MAEIVNVTYKTADGTEWPLQMEKLVRIKSANFHNWIYEPETLARRYGVRVMRFGKTAAAYITTLYFGGSIEDRKTRIDDFHTAIEKDLRAGTPGRLTWLDWYIDCFIRTSSTYPDQKTDYTVNDVEVYVPYPFWIKPRTVSFERQEYDPDAYDWLDYPYDYAFDYSPEPAGEGQIVNDATGPAEFKLIYYGPIADPRATIAGIPRGVSVILEEDDYLTIDSRQKTVILQKANGDTINAFNYRDKGQSIFTPIPIGGSQILWPGTFGFDLTIYRERSEPAWS